MFFYLYNSRPANLKNTSRCMYSK